MRGRGLLPVIAVSCLLASDASALVGETHEAGVLAAHVVMVLKRDGSRSGFCSGVALSRRIVLTGAHCVASLSDTRVHFMTADGPALVEPSRIERHPAYRSDAVETRRVSIDLALIEAKEDLPSSFVPAELAPRAPDIGDVVTIAGYGRREDGATGKLAALTLSLRAPLSTVLMWLAAPRPPGGACDGDSGAPVFDGNGRLAGVVAFAEGSAGRRCGKLTQAVSVVPQRAWIERIVARWAR